MEYESILQGNYYFKPEQLIKTGLPRNIIQIISVICMFIGFVMVTTVEIQNTLLFILIILITNGLFNNNKKEYTGWIDYLLDQEIKSDKPARFLPLFATFSLKEKKLIK